MYNHKNEWESYGFRPPQPAGAAVDPPESPHGHGLEASLVHLGKHHHAIVDEIVVLKPRIKQLFLKRKSLGTYENQP